MAHVPVLSERVVELLQPADPRLVVDATVGLGGHAEAVLERFPGARLLGLDRDPRALEAAQQRLLRFGDRIQLEQARFSQLPRLLAECRLEPPCAILADLGCSSLQLDSSTRGFSFRHEATLDMRMELDGPTAADLLDQIREEELMRILSDYGEERRARAIAREVLRRRRDGRLRSTGDLAAAVVSVLGPARRGRVHPATRTFQALRIAVNDELGELERFLAPSVRTLRSRGRMAVVSFHSLEDRLVKHTFRRLSGVCTCPPNVPECRCGARREARILTPRPLRPDMEETAANPRARSARLRAVERCSEEDR